MKLSAPKYYKDFKCLANRCTHSCCVGWEIEVDKEALRRYKKLDEAGADILSSIEESEQAAHFVLGEKDRCPHLRGDGLCRLICDFGEEYLCDICREHPRFYNFNANGCEVGVGASCEAAAALILDSDSYFNLVDVGDVTDCGDVFLNSYDISLQRERLYAILSDKSISYAKRLSLIYDAFSVSPRVISDKEWRSVISELEFLSEDSRELFLKYAFDTDVVQEKYAERALAYFIYRHTGSAESQDEFIAFLGLALFLERLFVSVTAGVDKKEIFTACLVKISEEIEYSEDNTERIKSEFWFI